MVPVSRLRVLRMVERAGGGRGGVAAGEYRKASECEVASRLVRGLIEVSGVDGDEETNTVTYWYDRVPREER